MTTEDQKGAVRTPAERLMDDVRWKELAALEEGRDGLWATHEGTLEIGDISLRCYTLNDGRRILDADDVHKHFFPSEPTHA